MLAVVHHHGYRQPGQPALLLTAVADLPVQLEVAGGLFTAVAGRCNDHRLAGLRINHLLRYRGGARRLVAQGAGDTDRRLPGHALLAEHLLAAQHGVGTEALGGGFQGTEVHIGGHLGTITAVAQYRLQDAVHAPGVGIFQTSGVLELATGNGQLVELVLIGQQVAVLVDHRHLILAQLGYAGRHQIDDGHDLGGLQLAPGIELEQNRGAGLAVIPDKHGGARHGNVHPRRLDVVETGDGPGQLAFQAPAILGGLHELAGTQTALAVENLETDIAVTLGDTGTGQLQACIGQVL